MIISQIPHVIGKCKKINEMVEIPKKKIKRGLSQCRGLHPKPLNAAEIHENEVGNSSNVMSQYSLNFLLDFLDP